MNTNFENFLNDPFILERLNPYFLLQVKSDYALILKSNEDSQIRLAEVQLKRLILRELFKPLYLDAHIKPEGSIFFLSRIFSDGLGDYFSLIKSAECFFERHPQYEIHLAYSTRREVPHVENKKFIIHPFFEPDPIYFKALENIWEGHKPLFFKEELKKLKLLRFIDSIEKKIGELTRLVEYEKESKKIYAALKKANSIVNIALAFNTFENPKLAPKSLYFSEAGNFQGIANSLRFNWYSMGLGAYEEGFFLKPRLPKKTNQNIYTAYLTHNLKQLKVFIELVGLLEKEKGVIHLPKKWKDTSFEVKPHIKLIFDLPLPQNEFLELLALSKSPVGCTGDMSLSEVLSLGKIPFYEYRQHKADTLKAFGNLSKNSLKAYFEAMAEENPELLFKHFKNHFFLHEWEHFLGIINKYYRFEESLNSNINRQLIHKKAQKWEDFFIEKDYSPEQAYSKLTKVL